jgi:hypothetical protein
MTEEEIQRIRSARTLNWYVLYTAPRAEKKVEERLRERGVECYLPLHRSPQVWSDRVKIVDKPLFISYVFVRSTETEALNFVRQIYGVARAVFYNGRPAIVQPSEIEAIRAFLEQAANHPLSMGEEVEILSGALKKVSGVIQKMGRNRLRLYIEQIGITVTVDLSEVAPVKRIK